jgi:hypothetical protein
MSYTNGSKSRFRERRAIGRYLDGLHWYVVLHPEPHWEGCQKLEESAGENDRQEQQDCQLKSSN